MSNTAGSDVRAIVLDTNIVLDLLVFNDPATPALAEVLKSGTLRWIASQSMRDELERVLDYKHIAPRLQFYKLTVADVLQRFDAGVQLVEVAAKVPVTCKDADDQKFIDLAVAHKAVLLSKDKLVLALAKRMRALGAETSRVYLPPAASVL